MAKKAKEVPSQMEYAVDAGFGWCRANQHIWQNPNGKGSRRIELVDRDRQVKVTFSCANCKGEREDHVLLKTGELVYRQYNMPQGYVLTVGSKGKRPTKSDWRKAHYGAIVKSVKRG